MTREDALIAALDAKLAELKVKRREAARKEREQSQRVLGRYVLAMMKQDEAYRETIYQGLDSYLNQDHERRLFDLPPRSKPEPE